jgi:hypothetical protein
MISIILSSIYFILLVKYYSIRIYYISENQKKENYAKENFYIYLYINKLSHLYIVPKILLISISLINQNYNFVFYILTLFILFDLLLYISSKIRFENDKNIDFTSFFESGSISFLKLFKYERSGFLNISNIELLKIFLLFFIEMYILKIVLINFI